MTPDEMEALIEAHLRAEGSGDPDGAVANYTEDVEHDVVGFPGSPLRGLHTYSADDAAVIENLMTATVTGQFLGIPGNGKQVRFRALHVFEFRDGRISRENLLAGRRRARRSTEELTEPAAAVGAIPSTHHAARAPDRRRLI